MQRLFFKKAFTLAEVLITLGIIGIVAEITIPTVMLNMQNQQRVVMLKKMYSVLSQAYNLSLIDNGTPNQWGLSNDTAGSIAMAGKLVPYLKIIEDCKTNNGCFPNVMYKYLNGNDYANVYSGSLYKIRLKDGTPLAFESFNPNSPQVSGSSQALQNIYGSLFFDLNGDKQPNKMGVDYFSFYVTKFGIIPRGTNFEYDLPNGLSFSSDCKDKSANYGYGCAAWVLYNENLDYLKCSNLSWNGPSKCP